MKPSEQLISEVKAGFIRQGKKRSLHRFCKENGIDAGNAHRVLTGVWVGKKASEYLRLIVNAAQIDIEVTMPMDESNGNLD